MNEMDVKEYLEIVSISDKLIDRLEELIENAKDFNEKKGLSETLTEFWAFYTKLILFQSLDVEFLGELTSMGFEISEYMFERVRNGERIKGLESNLRNIRINIQLEWGKYEYTIEQRYEPALFHHGNSMIGYARRETFLKDLKRVVLKGEFLLKISKLSRMSYYERQVMSSSKSLESNTRTFERCKDEIRKLEAMEGQETLKMPEERKIIKEKPIKTKIDD